MTRPDDFAPALAEDARSLALLHGAEVDGAILAALRAVGFPDNLGLLPESESAHDAWTLMNGAIQALPEAPTTADLDELAADFAALYLTGAHGVSPCESVWGDEDHLACQATMFDLRARYAREGLAVPNWRQRPDHLLRRPVGLDAGLVPDPARRSAPDCPNEVIPAPGDGFSRTPPSTGPVTGHGSPVPAGIPPDWRPSIS